MEHKTADACCGPSRLLMTAEEAERRAASFKALSDPVRLRIYHHIASSDHSVCFCHLPEVFGVSQPTLSHHLKKLVEAGLVTREQRGRWAHYSPRPAGLAQVIALVGDVSGRPDGADCKRETLPTEEKL
ncbi:ArsR/SmtB family transcription factor [Luteococcus sp. OSA5]|uniref:ArsR/SmtB family transcription factor n=1 Tax=Luteococcus sp. OSA5 TaxID=3401630 RepID=UPI003B428B66